MVASPSALMARLTFACTDQSITDPIQSWIVLFRSGQVIILHSKPHKF